jgi:hypothetical protein
MRKDDGGYLWVVFCVSRMQGDCFQVETTVKVDSSDDISWESLARRKDKGPFRARELTVASAQYPIHHR